MGQGQSNQNPQNVQNLQRLRPGRKDLEIPYPLNNFRMKFEATRSFDLEDDLEFCPGLLTESDVSTTCASPGPRVTSSSR